jgi:integrase
VKAAVKTNDLKEIKEQIAALTAMLEKAKKPRKRKAPEEIKYFTQDEIARLFAVIQSPRDRAIFRVGYHHGLRASEIGMLQLSHYRVKSGRLYVTRLKGSNSGEYKMPRSARQALDAWLEVRGYHDGVLFPSRFGTGISEQMLDVLVKRYAAAAGLQPRELHHFHTLKHSCGTHLMEGGPGRPRMDMAAVQDWMGHVNPQSTAVYAKITNRVRDEVGSAIAGW